MFVFFIFNNHLETFEPPLTALMFALDLDMQSSRLQWGYKKAWKLFLQMRSLFFSTRGHFDLFLCRGAINKPLKN